MQPRYPRTPLHCFPKSRGALGNATYGDSAVVAWLRPRLRRCANVRLGYSYVLQRGCEDDAGFDFCRDPPSHLNYSKLRCRPWERLGACS